MQKKCSKLDKKKNTKKDILEKYNNAIAELKNKKIRNKKKAKVITAITEINSRMKLTLT